jgi:hypothetical protein
MHEHRHVARVAALAITAFVAACAATAPGTRDPGVVTVMTGDGVTYDIQRGADIRVDESLTFSADRAWAVLPDVYDELGIETDVFDPTSRQVGVTTQRISRRFLDRPASDYFDCGLDPGLNRPLADQVPINTRIVTTVIPNGASAARLRTAVEGSARRNGGNAGAAGCRSTGMLERVIARMVEVRATG